MGKYLPILGKYLAILGKYLPIVGKYLPIMGKYLSIYPRFAIFLQSASLLHLLTFLTLSDKKAPLLFSSCYKTDPIFRNLSAIVNPAGPLAFSHRIRCECLLLTLVNLFCLRHAKAKLSLFDAKQTLDVFFLLLCTDSCAFNGKWQMTNGKWQMANGKWRMANGKWQMANGE